VLLAPKENLTARSSALRRHRLACNLSFDTRFEYDKLKLHCKVGDWPMSVNPSLRTANQAAWRRLRSAIADQYPKGRFVAIGDDRILADAASFEELQTVLRGMGRRRGQSLIVEVGAELPDYVTILLPD
jgi:hypothetical protein